MRSGHPFVAAALAVLLAPAAAARAQVPFSTDLKSLSLEELGSIEVTSVSKEPAAVWNTPAAIYVLTREDILRSGATSVPDALRLVPGVEVARIDTSRNWVVGIRGFGDQYSKAVLLLIDGRSAYTPLWAGVHWPIQDTILEDVDRIEVIRGPGATVWGANAENGVINIITRSAAATHGVYASATTGNVDRAMGGFRFGGSAGGVDYRAFARGIDRAPQFHADGREFDTWQSFESGFRADWTRGRDQLMVEGGAYADSLGESVLVSTFVPVASYLVDDPVDLRGGNVNARWRRTYSAGSDLSIQGYWDHTYRLGTDFGERRDTFDLDAIRHWQAGRHDLISGLGARSSPGEIIQTYAFSDFQPHRETLNLFSAFAQDSFAVTRRVTLVGGVKLEHNSYTGLETQPSGRVLWRVKDHQTVWGEVTRAVRIPSRVDEDITVNILAVASPPLFAVITGNPALQAERLIGSEIGYRTLLARSLYLDVTAFHNNYDDLVDTGPPTIEPRTMDGLTYTAFVVPWINGIKGITRGVELAPDWQATSHVRVRGSYSFVGIALDAKPGNTRPNTLPTLEGSTPRHQVVVQSLLTLRGGLTLDPTYRYVGERAVMKIPAYHTADVRLAIPLSRGFELAVVAQNLLQPHHPEWARDPGPTVDIRRAGYVRLTWRQ